MQPIASHLSLSGRTPAPSLQNSAIAPSDTSMRTLWLRMLEFYNHKWSSAYGESFEGSGTAGRTWQTGLAGITPAQIGDGLRALLNRADPWPPTLPEFRALCVPAVTTQPSPDDWKSSRADKAKMPGPKRLQWHQDNIAHVEKGGELPREGVTEPAVWE